MKRLLIALTLFLPLVFAASCFDGDGGVDYFVKSSCEDPRKEKTDYCLDGERIAEYYCSGTDTGYCWATSYNCKSVEGSAGECVDGACVRLPEEAEPSPSPEPSKKEGSYDIGVLPTPAPKEYSNDEAPKAAEDFPFWLLLSGAAILLLIAYRSSQERMVVKKKKKRRKKRR